MRFRVVVRAAVVSGLLLGFLNGGQCSVFAQQKTATAAKPGELTVDRIFAQPSLSGRLTRGIAWAPDNKRLSFSRLKAAARRRIRSFGRWTPRREYARCWFRRKSWRAHCLRRRVKLRKQPARGGVPPAQYQWAPGGDALLLEGPHALAWFDLKSQTARVLVSGKEDLSDEKISPDGKYVSFVREHNVWLVSTADGKETRANDGRNRGSAKGELDWVYPKSWTSSPGYWWAPDSSAIAYLEMDERKVTQFSL